VQEYQARILDVNVRLASVVGVQSTISQSDRKENYDGSSSSEELGRTIRQRKLSPPHRLPKLAGKEPAMLKYSQTVELVDPLNQ